MWAQLGWRYDAMSRAPSSRTAAASTSQLSSSPTCIRNNAPALRQIFPVLALAANALQAQPALRAARRAENPTRLRWIRLIYGCRLLQSFLILSHGSWLNTVLLQSLRCRVLQSFQISSHGSSLFTALLQSSRRCSESCQPANCRRLAAMHGE